MNRFVVEGQFHGGLGCNSLQSFALLLQRPGPFGGVVRVRGNSRTNPGSTAPRGRLGELVELGLKAEGYRVEGFIVEDQFHGGLGCRCVAALVLRYR